MTSPLVYTPDLTNTLKGKTLFITGGSRGIGLAIAKRAAQDGANIVIAAKTSEPHARLPGTIYTAADEISAAGGQVLPLQMDLRHETEVENAVMKAIETFGGIDILVNNASAIAIGGVNEVSMKKFDLMTQINLRGTILATKCCLPYLKKSTNAHILTLCPPPSLDPKWFKDTLPYTLAKMGMSFSTIGLSEEFKPDGIAANALWPRTAIDTAAIRNELGGAAIAQYCRADNIMADAAHAILCKNSTEYTGHFCIDDEVLFEEGLTNLDHYAIKPGEKLILDFFLNSGPNGSMDGYIRMPL
ncbi:MAG: short chain dehydrogenase [Rhodospirillaceae bacterium]|nr:short chain dehydrogenase [Rhodospirillaceae bacterium]